VQAGQAFLPPAIGYMAARPVALGRRLLGTGAAVGVGNAAAASGVLLFGAGAFAGDPLVVAQVSEPSTPLSVIAQLSTTFASRMLRSLNVKVKGETLHDKMQQQRNK
jgi:hypothetical protein